MSESTALAHAHDGEPRGALQLAFEPQSFDALTRMCGVLFASGLLPKAIAKVEAAIYIALRGRELGLTIGQSFASIFIVDGKTVMASDLIVARVKRSRECAVWHIDSSTNEECTITAQRAGDDKPTTLTWNIADAKRAGLLTKQNWQGYPRAMLRARCSSELARAVFPDVAMGMYDPDEIANDNRHAAPSVVPAREELVGEVVQAAAPAPAPPPVRKASEVAREIAEHMRQAPDLASLDGLWDGARQMGFKETMLAQLGKVWEDCKAKFIPDMAG